jgi:hypothetical protein
MASSIIQEFIQSLDEEIETIKKGKGGSIVKIFNGRFLREISGLFVYVFHLENFLAALEESPAEVEIRGSRYPAQVLLTQGLEVEIGIEHFCGQFISEAKLQTNLWYLLELLKKKYTECQNGSVKMDFHLSEVIFSGQQADSKSTSQAEIRYLIGKEPPNEAQKEAIEASFSSELSVIWGPPGTGKTKTIAKATEAHLNAGRRVLLVSHANNAVDEALEDVAEHLKTTPFYQEGKLVRLGKPQEEHLKKLEEEYELVLLDKIAEKLGESLAKEKNTLENERRQIENTLARFESTFRALQTMKILSTELDTLKLSVLESAKQLTEAQNELIRVEESQRRNRERFIEAQSAGAFKRLFGGLDPQRIQRDIDLTSMSLDSKARLVREIYTRVNELKHSFQAKEYEASTAKGEAELLLQDSGVSPGELEYQKKALEHRKDTIQTRIAEINQQLDEIQSKILSEARLVATTLTKTFVAKQFPQVPFDVLVLDEASMAPLPHLYWAAAHCGKSATIVGDFLQLPPICIADDKPMAKKWLGTSIFDILNIRSVEGAKRDSRVRLLDTQYRMVPKIADVSNRFFYGGILKNAQHTLNKHMSCDGVAESPLVLIETAAMNPWCSRLSTGGRFNLYNALVCATLAKRIIQYIPDGRIGILTPYVAQARLIKKIAKDWELLDRVSISNVHRFQGGEEPIIIFDTAEGIGTKVAPMLDDTKHDSDARLVLNVALTRAKSRLYLVGHTQKLLSDLHSDSALSRIVRHFQQEAETFESETLVDNYFTNDFERWAEALLSAEAPIREPVSGELYTEQNFWAQFFQDIKGVKERLIILSPFLSIRRSSMFMDYFRVMIGRGVKVKIYTRPANQQVGEMANQADVVIRQLRSIDTNVIERRSMHQKVAILDNSITWEGSLNILSHRDTEEHMRRFEGPSAIEEIIRNLDLEEENPVGTQTPEKCPGSQRLPNCNGYLVIRSSPKLGRKFLGCSNFPRCDYTRSMDGPNRRRR